jgi:hypothetical protein
MRELSSGFEVRTKSTMAPVSPISDPMLQLAVTSRRTTLAGSVSSVMSATSKTSQDPAKVKGPLVSSLEQLDSNTAVESTKSAARFIGRLRTGGKQGTGNEKR